MAPKVMLLLGTCALIISQVESLWPCNPVNRDCTCSDFSYLDCIEPVSDTKIHTPDLEQCIFQCDLFASFGSCDWLLFDQTDGMDENCHLFGPGKESMEDYISSCNVRGHPTRDIDNKCYIDPQTPGADPLGFCKAGGSDQCPGGCKTCNTDDVCSKIHETECTMEDPGTDNSDSAPTEAGCNLLCTQLGVNDEVSYLTYAQREETCICYPVGKRSCNNIIMKQGVTLDDYFNCQTGNVPDQGCKEDADCQTPDYPPGFLCDQRDHLCKPDCHKHEDCDDSEYCDCDIGADCPDGGVGLCKAGCRDLGDPCPTGNCNSEHVCTPPGIPKIQKITAATLACDGCDPNNEGATMTFTVNNANGAGQTCTTGVLDNPGTTDYGTANTGIFNTDSLGGCKLFEAYVVTGMTINWNGAGGWKPEKVTVDITMDICCKNAGLAIADASHTISLECGQGPAFCS